MAACAGLSATATTSSAVSVVRRSSQVPITAGLRPVRSARVRAPTLRSSVQEVSDEVGAVLPFCG